MKSKYLLTAILGLLTLTAMTTASFGQSRNLEDIPDKRLLRETLLRMKQQPSLPGLKRYQDRAIVNELKFRLGGYDDEQQMAKMTFRCFNEYLRITFKNDYGQTHKKDVHLGYNQNCQRQLKLLNRKLATVREPTYFALCTRFDIARYYEVTPDSLRETHAGYVRPYANCLAEAQRVTRSSKRW